jgi:hypothetical protein
VERAQGVTTECRSVDMIDKIGRAHSGFETASIRVGGPVAAARAGRGIANERLSKQADEFLAIDGIHPPRI